MNFSVLQPFLKVIDVIMDQANVKDELRPITISSYPLLLFCDVNSINHFQKKNGNDFLRCTKVSQIITRNGQNTELGFLFVLMAGFFALKDICVLEN